MFQVNFRCHVDFYHIETPKTQPKVAFCDEKVQVGKLIAFWPRVWSQPNIIVHSITVSFSLHSPNSMLGPHSHPSWDVGIYHWTLKLFVKMLDLRFVEPTKILAKSLHVNGFAGVPWNCHLTAFPQGHSVLRHVQDKNNKDQGFTRFFEPCSTLTTVHTSKRWHPKMFKIFHLPKPSIF